MYVCFTELARHGKERGIFHSDLAVGRPSSVEGEYPESDACSRLGGQFVRLEYLLEMSGCSMIKNIWYFFCFASAKYF